MALNSTSVHGRSINSCSFTFTFTNQEKAIILKHTAVARVVASVSRQWLLQRGLTAISCPYSSFEACQHGTQLLHRGLESWTQKEMSDGQGRGKTVFLTHTHALAAHTLIHHHYWLPLYIWDLLILCHSLKNKQLIMKKLSICFLKPSSSCFSSIFI